MNAALVRLVWSDLPGCLLAGKAGPAGYSRRSPQRAGPSLAAHQACRVTVSSAVPVGLVADTMWMPLSCSQVCMAASSTPYSSGAARVGYPEGYGAAQECADY
jgi:hypothetical protein